MMKVRNLVERLKQLFVAKLDDFRHKYEVLECRLKLCSEESILRRGFSRIVSYNNQPISYEKVEDNMKVKIKMFGGTFECNLTNVRKNGENG